MCCTGAVRGQFCIHTKIRLTECAVQGWAAIFSSFPLDLSPQNSSTHLTPPFIFQNPFPSLAWNTAGLPNTAAQEFAALRTLLPLPTPRAGPLGPPHAGSRCPRAGLETRISPGAELPGRSGPAGRSIDRRSAGERPDRQSAAGRLFFARVD